MEASLAPRWGQMGPDSGRRPEFGLNPEVAARRNTSKTSAQTVPISPNQPENRAENRAENVTKTVRKTVPKTARRTVNALNKRPYFRMVDTYATPFLFDRPSGPPAWHDPGDHPPLVRNRRHCRRNDPRRPVARARRGSRAPQTRGPAARFRAPCPPRTLPRPATGRTAATVIRNSWPNPPTRSPPPPTRWPSPGARSKSARSSATWRKTKTGSARAASAGGGGSGGAPKGRGPSRPSSGACDGCNSGRNTRSILCPTARGAKWRWRSTPRCRKHSPGSSPANREVITQRLVDAAVHRALRPWTRKQEIERALQAGMNKLAWDVRYRSEYAPLKQRAWEAAVAAVGKVREEAELQRDGDRRGAGGAADDPGV